MKDFTEQQEIWNEAGVAGGIPTGLTVVATVKAGDSIQAGIDAAYALGGGVVLLEKGVHEVSSSIYLKSGVVVRGVDREEVIVESSIKSYASSGDGIHLSDAVWYAKQNATFLMDRYYDGSFKNVENAGIENLTLDYVVPGLETDPTDFNNFPGGNSSLFTSHIKVGWGAEDNWVKDVNVFNAGTDPILLLGNNNTFTGNHVSGSFNKGKDGNGYYNIMGDNNLIQNETVEGIRHFAIQWQAKNNVVVDSDIRVDVNFHNKDFGGNLVEGNKINLPAYHFADPITTGVARLHSAPGPDNVIFNNEVSHGNPRKNDQYDPDTVYTYFGNFGDPRPTDWDAPAGGKFYTADMGNFDDAPAAPVNMAPVVADDDVSVDEDASIVINATDIATDPEGGLLTISVVEGPQNGLLTQDGDGALQYTPAPNYAGADSAVVEVADSAGAVTRVTLTLDVTAQNDAPVAANDDGGSVTAGDMFTLTSLLENDGDIEGDALDITSVTANSGNFFASLSVDANGNVVGTLAKDATGTGTFTYTVSDGKGGTDTATVAVKATAPIVPVITGVLVTETGPLTAPEPSVPTVTLVTTFIPDVMGTVVTATPAAPTVVTTVVATMPEVTYTVVSSQPVQPVETTTTVTSFMPATSQPPMTVTNIAPASQPVAVTTTFNDNFAGKTTVTSSVPDVKTVAVTQTDEQPVLAINIGSNNSFTAADGTVFAADTTGVGRRFSTQEDILLTDDDALYQTEAWGPNGLNYAFDLADGHYDVVLHFAEIWAPARDVGVRVFDIAVEDQIVVDGLDLAESGFRETVLINLDVEVTDGTLNLDFLNDVQNSKLSAIEIWRDNDANDMMMPVEQDLIVVDNFAEDIIL